jgi:SAM-dependent methyltransferase
VATFNPFRGATKPSTPAPDGPRLNLGCGRFPKAGFVNVDREALPGVDVVHDLARTPYPFPDGHFARVEADHVLEHLPDAFGAMREIHRVLMPGGWLVVAVPHFSRAMSHPEHARGFDITFPYYFDPTFPGGYCGVPFECLSAEMHWFAQPWLKRQVLPPRVFQAVHAVGRVVDALAHASPAAAARVWCFAVGGFEEVRFTFRKPG